MCGIFLFGSKAPITGRAKPEIEKRFQKLKHRGPDESSVKYYNANVMLGFHRLAITSPLSSGMQPFHSPDARYAAITNGEIYNFKAICKTLSECPSCAFSPKTGSDCEVVLPLFLHFLNCVEGKGEDAALDSLCRALDGEFAFILCDTFENAAFFGVDELRVRPLFYAFDGEGNFYLSSEQKPLSFFPKIAPVPPGTFGSFDLVAHRLSAFKRHFDFDFYRNLRSFSGLSFEQAATALRELFVGNVERKLNPEREFAFLLSGGLDSSLVCSVASRLLSPRRIHTFTFGFSKDAPDVRAAERVAEFIDSIHETFLFDYESGARLVESEVVYFGETWDQTTVRASTAMLLGLKRMKEKHPNLAVLYSGEVADELMRGYLYNLRSPNAAEGRLDSIDLLENITYFDGLRADRMASRVSCELRLPFFSRDLLKFVLSLPPDFTDPQKNDSIEKKLLRVAFDKDQHGNALNYLPPDLLWRTKHALSDATSVRGGWRAFLLETAENKVHDSRLRAREALYGDFLAPQTKEDMWYRELFDQCGYEAKTVPRKWLPKWSKEGLVDSSATVLNVFHED